MQWLSTMGIVLKVKKAQTLGATNSNYSGVRGNVESSCRSQQEGCQKQRIFDHEYFNE